MMIINSDFLWSLPGFGNTQFGRELAPLLIVVNAAKSEFSKITKLTAFRMGYGLNGIRHRWVTVVDSELDCYRSVPSIQ